MTPLLPALAATAALLTRFESGDLRGLVLAETGSPTHPEQFADDPALFARLTVVDGRPTVTVQVVWFGFAGQIEHAEATYPYDRLAALARQTVAAHRTVNA